MNDVVGHELDESFLQDQSENSDDYEYEEYEEYEDYDKENDYYDYDYLEEERSQDKQYDDYEYYEEEPEENVKGEGVLKLSEYNDEYYDNDYSHSYDYATTSEKVEIMKNEDKDDMHENQFDVEEYVNSSLDDDADSNHNLSTQNNDDEDFLEGSGEMEDHTYAASSKPTTSTETTTTTESTTTTTESTTTSESTTKYVNILEESSNYGDEEYYFEEEDDDDDEYKDESSYYEGGSGDYEYDYEESGDLPNLNQEDVTNEAVDEKNSTYMSSFATDDEDLIDDGSGNEENILSEKNENKSFINISDDEDLIEGSYDYNEISTEDDNENIDIEIQENLTEEETRKRSEFFELHGIDILSLDMSCMKNFVSAPDLIHGNLVQYQYNGDNDKQFAEAIFDCDEGYQLLNPNISSLFCQNGTWKGEMPKCLFSGHISSDHNGKQRHWCSEDDLGECQQKCYFENGEKLCDCHRGYRLDDDDGHTCTDINECEVRTILTKYF